MKKFVLAFILLLTAHQKVKAECVGCGQLLWIIPGVAVTLDLGTSTVVWGGGELFGGEGSFWKTYLSGLGAAFLGGIIGGTLEKSPQGALTGVLIGIPVGNVIGYGFSMKENPSVRGSTEMKLSSELIKIKF